MAYGAIRKCEWNSIPDKPTTFGSLKVKYFYPRTLGTYNIRSRTKCSTVRGDMLGVMTHYAFEIQKFYTDVRSMLKLLIK